MILPTIVLGLVFGSLVFVFMLDPARSERPIPNKDKIPVKEPKIQQLDAPQPPQYFRYWNIQSETVAEFTVTPEGDTKDIKILQASRQEMVQPTVQAIKEAKFSPALNEKDNPVEFRMRIPFRTGERPQVTNRPRIPKIVEAPKPAKHNIPTGSLA